MSTENTNMRVAHLSLSEWGMVMRLARASSMLALEDAKRRKWATNNMDASILLYTDDPSTAGALMTCPDMEDVLGVSQIEAVSIVMGDDFPQNSHEANRPDPEMPRIAAMWFPAVGEKCPRCRKKVEVLAGEGLCQRCHDVVYPPVVPPTTLWSRLKGKMSSAVAWLRGILEGL